MAVFIIFPRQEAARFVLGSSLRRLQYATEAAVEQGLNEGTWQRAAIAILDRAGLETAAKSEPPGQLRLWFDNLKRIGEEEEEAQLALK